jgi:hypothetical protein
MSTVQEKSRTQLVREILSELGADTDIDKVKKELRKRHGVTIHETAIYTERRKLREEIAKHPVPQPAPQPKPQPAPAAVVPVVATVLPANPLRVFADGLDTVKAQVAKLEALVAEVGGYENLALLVDVAKKLK